MNDSPPPDSSRLERWLTLVLVVAALDTIYLAWRFTALYAGWVTPGTGICSWSSGIDCDKVLQTPEARTFVVPNAVLGMGFYTGALIWWLAGRRLGPAYKPHLIRSLAFWLGIASLLTFWFWRLLLGLDVVCPFCPWNHLLTYVALFLAVRIWRLTPHPPQHAPWKPLLVLVAVCVAWFWFWQVAWFVAEAAVLKSRHLGQTASILHTEPYGVARPLTCSTTLRKTIGLMPYTLTIEPKPGHLHFIVSGPNTKETVARYLTDVLRECIARNCYRILVEERLEGPRLHTVDVFDLISEGSEKILGLFKAIAYVDVNAAGKLMKFAETVAVNRSLPMAVFNTVAEAEAWLNQSV